VGVLLLHRTLPAVAVIAGVDAALAIPSVDPDLVAVEARRSMLAGTTPPPVPLPAALAATVPAAVERPVPSLAGYDDLLNGATA